METKSHSWQDIAELTHETQVAEFNFCSCEDNWGKENPYADCPPQLCNNCGDEFDILDEYIGMCHNCLNAYGAGVLAGMRAFENF